MNEESFTSSGSTTVETYPGAPHSSPLQQKASQTGQSFQNEAERLKGTAREQTAAAIEQMKAGVQSATSQAQQAGKTFLRQQQDSLAGRCSAYAQAARTASQCLSSGETQMLANPAAIAADKLDQIANYLKKEPADLLGDVETFARRRPEVVFGGLFVLGLAAARFLKASGRDLEERQRSAAFEASRDYSAHSDFDHGMETGVYSSGMQAGSSFHSSSGPSTTAMTTPSAGTAETSVPPWSTNVVPETPASSEDTLGGCGCSTTGPGSSTKNPLS